MKEVKTPKKPLIFYYAVAMLAVFLFNFFAMPWLAQHQIKEVDYNTFVEMVEQDKVGKVEIQEQDNRILFTDKDESVIYKTAMVSDDDLSARLLEAGVSFKGEEIEQTSLLVDILGWVLPILIFIALGQYMSKKMADKLGGGNSMMFGLGGNSNVKVYVQSTEGIHFSDVAGEDEAKENLQEVVNYLHDPSKYQEIGASMPKGILLVGPPGTGKTMLAKAVAGESNVPFFSISGSEFVEMFVGMGASKVRDLFSQAKEKAPCIVFIDEIDAIGQKRSGGQYGGNDEREQTLNQLLTEMDGFDDNSGVIILAATNRPESLDPALTRPGRFDRRVPVELPDLKGREEILKVHAKKIKLAENVDFSTVARMASGASGAELANIVNEAALRAVRDGRKLVTQADLEESIETVIAGYQKKNAILTDREKWIVSYHEIGHALVAARQTHSAPVQKITIIPRTSGALGYTMQVEEEERVLMSKEDLLNQIITHLIEVQCARGNMHLFLYTKVKSSRFFGDLGFYEIARVEAGVGAVEGGVLPVLALNLPCAAIIAIDVGHRRGLIPADLVGVDAALRYDDRLLDGAGAVGIERGGGGALDKIKRVHKRHRFLRPALHQRVIRVGGELGGVAGVGIAGVLLHILQRAAEEGRHLLTVQGGVGGEGGRRGAGGNARGIGLEDVGVVRVGEGVRGGGRDALAGQRFRQTHRNGAEDDLPFYRQTGIWR